MAVRVGIVDDHKMIREGLRAVFAREPDLEVVGEAGNAAEVWEMMASTSPDVIVLDLGLPGVGGLSVIRELARRKHPCRVVVYTMHGDEFYVAEALASGATGYVVKGPIASEIVDAVRAAARGERYLSAGLSRHAQDEIGPGRDGARSRRGSLAELSSREREIFDLIVRGLSNKEIAKQLSISIKTVETHRAHINKKLAVHSTGELIRFAAAHGLVSRVGDAPPAPSLPLGL